MHDLYPIFSMIIPVVAIVGGITLAIVRVIAQARIEELARKERIAALERGVDPEKLPAIAGTAGFDTYSLGSSRLRRAHGLLIGGLILVAIGIGMAIVFASVEPEKRHWLIGTVPILVGGAMLLASRVVWPTDGETPKA
jgi:hypothetical protein